MFFVNIISTKENKYSTFKMGSLKDLEVFIIWGLLVPLSHVTNHPPIQYSTKGVCFLAQLGRSGSSQFTSKIKVLLLRDFEETITYSWIQDYFPPPFLMPPQLIWDYSLEKNFLGKTLDYVYFHFHQISLKSLELKSLE